MRVNGVMLRFFGSAFRVPRPFLLVRFSGSYVIERPALHEAHDLSPLFTCSASRCIEWARRFRAFVRDVDAGLQFIHAATFAGVLNLIGLFTMEHLEWALTGL